MVLTLEQLVKILSSGGGLRVSANGYSVSQLTELAGAASSGRAQLQLVDVGALTAAQLIALADAAPGYIRFDLVQQTPQPPVTSGM
jgi:hypothetical protein